MPSYTGPIVDVDVHNAPPSSATITERLPKKWQDYVPIYPPVTPDGLLSRNMARRADTWGPDGAFPGSSYERLKEQLLDPYDYHRAILTHDIGHYAGLSNQYYAEAVCRAANDWIVEEWLPLDERLYSLIVVPSARPDVSAAEIRRVAEHPRMIGVLFAANPLDRPLGDPLYHPIYEAAAEHGLAISVHQEPPGTRDAGGIRMTSPLLDGSPAQIAMHYISSLVVHGVFEKFPGLHFVIKEFGVTWMPWLMWRLDQEYELLARESPWVKRLPSEYIRDHVKLSTQPLEGGSRRSDLVDYLSVVDGIEDLLCFSTDYPHHTMDDPLYVARQLPAEWHRKVFCDNACRAYGWEIPVADPAPATA
jgi:uncharacterized protein